MIVVIQCVAGKKPDAGHLLGTDGRKVMFVADPDAVLTRSQIPPGRSSGVTYAHARPDDISDTGKSWRTILRECNREYGADPGGNPHGLLPAWQLYQHPIYKCLAGRYGLKRLYILILSAGWGLIPADYLTPAYDITFTAGADKYKRRRKNDRYDDFRYGDSRLPPPPKTVGPIVFFGGKDYVDLFCALTEGVKAPRYLWYNSKIEPNAPGCVLRRFHTKTKTNWHYECAKAFVEGKIRLLGSCPEGVAGEVV